jgi:dTDP-4-amino-4,6-dideoxygalactose transaminase
MLRVHGIERRYFHDFHGYNSRLDELQAAILRVKLPSLTADNERRRKIAAKYREAIDEKKIRPPRTIDGTLHAMHLFVVQSEQRDELQDVMRAAGIATALHYPKPIHLQPAYAGRIKGADRLSETESLYRQILTLPMFPELTDSDVEKVCDVLRQWCATS